LLEAYARSRASRRRHRASSPRSATAASSAGATLARSLPGRRAARRSCLRR
jgi:hypothetical protein